MGRALVRQPSVFLFDEPLSNLDAKLRVDMRIEIKRLHQKTGTTIVYVTHDQIEAMTLATKIAVLKDGEVQQVGTPAEIYNTPTNLFVADFMGSPSMNLLEGEIKGVNGAANVLIARQGLEPIALPIPAGADVSKVADGAKVIFGIRPEAVNDPESLDRNARSVVKFDAPVEIVEPAGADTYVVTHAAGKELTARMRADAVGEGRREPHLRVQPRQGDAVRSRDVAAHLSVAPPEDLSRNQSWLTTTSSSAAAPPAACSPTGSAPTAR